MNNKDNNNKKITNLFKVLKDRFILAPFKYVSVFVAGVVFASGLVYAWNAVWHGTDWIKSGAVIESKKLGESLQYLYEKTVKKDNVPDCFGPDKVLQYKQNSREFICYTKPKPKRCRIGYQLNDPVSGQARWTNIVWTPWANFDDGNEALGPSVFTVREYTNYAELKMKLECQNLDTPAWLSYKIQVDNNGVNPINRPWTHTSKVTNGVSDSPVARSRVVQRGNNAATQIKINGVNCRVKYRIGADDILSNWISDGQMVQSREVATMNNLGLQVALVCGK